MGIAISEPGQSSSIEASRSTDVAERNGYACSKCKGNGSPCPVGVGNQISPVPSRGETKPQKRVISENFYGLASDYSLCQPHFRDFKKLKLLKWDKSYSVASL